MDKEYIPHVVENGSRKHVIHYVGGINGSYEVCNVLNCEVNKRWDERTGKGKIEWKIPNK